MGARVQAQARKRRIAWSLRRLLPRELPHHVLEDPAVPVILKLLRGVDPHDRAELERRPVGSRRLDAKLLAVREPFREHGGERSEEHTSELQSLAYLVCRLLLEKKKQQTTGDA